MSELLGPLKYSDSSGYIREVAGNGLVAIMNIGDYTRHEEYARLFVVAPKMLIELKTVVSFFDHQRKVAFSHLERIPLNDQSVILRDTLQALIAKTEPPKEEP